MTTRQHEQTLNVWLAEALELRGLNVNPEVIYPRNRRIDIEVRVGPVVIAVEAEHGQNVAKLREAVRDADARIAQNLAQCAVAVCYPDNTQKADIETGKYQWQVRDADSRGYSRAAWQSGGIDQLAQVIRLAPAQLGDPDVVAAFLSASLDEAVYRLKDAQKQELAKALDLPDDNPGKNRTKKSPKTYHKAAKRAMLVIATAAMFHARLDEHLADMRPKHDARAANADTPFTDEWPPRKAHICAAADAPIDAFNDAWDLILALDYKPIFETARAALQACAPDPSFSDAVRIAATAAGAVAQNIAGRRHDLLGRIFHAVLDTARYDGSFYTTTAAATLLASLAIDKDMRDWQDPDAVAGLRIVDPACGTGTLLMAAANRIREFARQSIGENETALTAVNKSLIEKTLVGYDVNLTATHMAATTLGLLSPTTLFSEMQIGRAFLGVDDAGVAYLGSLEFLDVRIKMIPWPGAKQAVSQIDSGAEMKRVASADLFILNPPFTRDSLRHDQFSREEERRIKNREKELFRDKPSVHLSGNSGPFLYMANFLRDADNGKVAAILPTVTATNASSLKMRQHIGQSCHVEYIVTSHDPERIYFSESTTIGEMLLVCRAWDHRKDPKPPTKVINFARNPATPADAMSVFWAIESGEVDSKGIGTVQEVSPEDIAAGDWGAVQFLSPALRADFAA